MAAATRIIVTQGLSAPTATIAKEAGVANGSLFTYFETKADLFNQLYLELKAEMASAALEGLPARATFASSSFTSGPTGCAGRCPIPRSDARLRSSAYPTISPRRAVLRAIRPWQASPS